MKFFEDSVMKNFLKFKFLFIFLFLGMPLFSYENGWEVVLVWDNLNGLIYAGLEDGISLSKKYGVYSKVGDYLGEFVITELGEEYSKGMLKSINEKLNLEVGDIVNELFEEEKEKQLENELINISKANEKEMEKESAGESEKGFNYEYFAENIGSIFFKILNQKSIKWKQAKLDMIASDAKLFIKAGLLKDALKLYEEGLNLDKTNISFYNNLALIYISLNDFEKAIDYLTEAVRLSPDDYVLHRNLSIAYFKSGLITEAKNEILKSKKCGDPFWEKVLDLINKFNSNQ